MLTSCVKATEHHSWKRSNSRWCIRSRGQCSPRLRCTTSVLPSPWSSDSRCITPFSSGSSKSGMVVRGSRFLLMESLLSGAHAGHLQAHAVDARQRGLVEVAAVLPAPREVVRVLRQLQEPEPLALGRDDPYAARPADVEVAGAVDLEPVDRVLARGRGHVVEHLAGAGHLARLVERIAQDDLALRVPVADV